jgi:hypothetical protein
LQTFIVLCYLTYYMSEKLQERALQDMEYQRFLIIFAAVK